jgi:hypothetical protein
MIKIKNKMKKLVFLFIALAGIMTVSCSKAIFDEEGDCSVHYRIGFKYDMNMKFADAFSNSVCSVHLYAFDESGLLVYKKAEGGEALKSEDYAMEVDMAPGTYTFIAWCGLDGGDAFSLCTNPVVGTTTIEQLQCELAKEYDQNNGAMVNDELNHLFHGMKKITLPEMYGTFNETMSLVKNTNTVKVILQNLSGEDILPDDYTYQITDDNGLMEHDNDLVDDETINYYPFSVVAGEAGVDVQENTKAIESVSIAVAEFTVGRLVTYRNPVLTITHNRNSEVVARIPLKDYALLVKGNYNRKMDDQEYLDRQDEYSLTFFLDEHGHWSTSQIIINSWRVVLQDTDM